MLTSYRQKIDSIIVCAGTNNIYFRSMLMAQVHARGRVQRHNNLTKNNYGKVKFDSLSCFLPVCVVVMSAFRHATETKEEHSACTVRLRILGFSLRYLCPPSLHFIFLSSIELRQAPHLFSLDNLTIPLFRHIVRSPLNACHHRQDCWRSSSP